MRFAFVRTGHEEIGEAGLQCTFPYAASLAKLWLKETEKELRLTFAFELWVFVNMGQAWNGRGQGVELSKGLTCMVLCLKD